MAQLRYFDATGQNKVPAVAPAGIAHSEFLRTGRIIRRKENWLAEERRYLTHAEVAERTGRRLEAAGEKTHERINGFHRSINFPKLIFHRTLEHSPHLGYCHVTTARTKFAKFDTVRWAFYIANFFSEIGGGAKFIHDINLNYSRMYFAVAMHPDSDKKKMEIDITVRGNGVLFRTHDPKVAFKNLLMLGTGNEKMREFIRTF